MDLVHENEQKGAICDKKAWTIAHENEQKCSGFHKNA